MSQPGVAGPDSANRIDRPGTAEDTWASWPELRRLPIARPLAWRSVVVVAAHPDDEVLGAGGTMAMLAAGGVRLRLIAVTDGEGSHPGTDPAGIARTRIAESVTALDRLGAGVPAGWPATSGSFEAGVIRLLRD